MKRLSSLILCSALCISLFGCGKEVTYDFTWTTLTDENGVETYWLDDGSEVIFYEDGTYDIIPYVPTLEETLGFTGDDLIQQDNQTKFQEYTITASMDYVASIDERDYAFNRIDKYVVQTDETVSYAIFTSVTNSDYRNSTISSLTYKDFETSSIYLMNNYDMWSHEELGETESYFHYNLDGSTCMIDSFTLNNNRLYAEGTASKVGSSDLDSYVSTWVEELGISSLTYSFKATYGGEDPYSLISIVITISTEEPISWTPTNDDLGLDLEGSYDGTLNSLTVTLVPTTNNDQDVVVVPQYVLDNVQSIIDEENDETEENTKEEIVSYTIDDLMCLYLYGSDVESDILIGLESNGITADLITNSIGVDGSATSGIIYEYITTYAYADLIALDTSTLDAEHSVAVTLVNTLMQNKAASESVPESEEVSTEPEQEGGEEVSQE